LLTISSANVCDQRQKWGPSVWGRKRLLPVMARANVTST
jgi:hypothetical protein